MSFYSDIFIKQSIKDAKPNIRHSSTSYIFCLNKLRKSHAFSLKKCCWESPECTRIPDINFFAPRSTGRWSQFGSVWQVDLIMPHGNNTRQSVSWVAWIVCAVSWHFITNYTNDSVSLKYSWMTQVCRRRDSVWGCA